MGRVFRFFTDEPVVVGDFHHLSELVIAGGLDHVGVNTQFVGPLDVGLQFGSFILVNSRVAGG
ncbi:MAG: hypothetical protein JWR26_2533 [Pedosphaera sp.]|nr:hypothetical protein [Pedosphaera sp.]